MGDFYWGSETALSHTLSGQGSKYVPKMGHFGAQNDPFLDPFLSQNHAKSSPFWAKMGQKRGQKRGQNRGILGPLGPSPEALLEAQSLDTRLFLGYFGPQNGVPSPWAGPGALGPLFEGQTLDTRLFSAYFGSQNGSPRGSGPSGPLDGPTGFKAIYRGLNYTYRRKCSYHRRFVKKVLHFPV